MNLLLDTHVFLWMLNCPEKLSAHVKRIVSSSNNLLYLSAASIWEISIKTRLGKLILPDIPGNYIPEMQFKYSVLSLPIEAAHSLYIYYLPDIHKDPFDRMIVSQSVLEDYPVITNDTLIKKYDVKTIW